MQELERQIERIKLWREAFVNDTTGIHKTVQDLLWNYAAFQTTVQIVHLAGERQDEGPTLNQMLFNLMREGYWSSLLLGTRRLLDRGALKGPQGVYSIRSVVNDVKASRDWLNRKIYVESVQGAEYDNQRLRLEMEKELAAAKRPIWGNPELSKSNAAHEYFDQLSGIYPSNRSCNDLIDPAIFDKIEARLASLDKISDHATTHVAHSGNVESRSIKKVLESFDIQNAQATLKQLKEVSTLIGVWFANEGSAGLATFLGDQFEGLDQPVISSSDIQKLEEQWQATDREIAKWHIGAEEL
jgi:hypothetical protein